MGKQVFANGREISAKANDNKSIAAMPDVCLSPPSPPAGPLPVPYPNTSDASKTSAGSKSVKIGGDEIGLKNKSDYKESNGDEAATKSLGMGTVTHTIQGKTQHAAYSSDVMIENENAIRHLDMTTHNHMNDSDPANSAATTVDMASMAPAVAKETPCEELSRKNDETRTALKQDSRKSYQKIGNESTTITHGTVTPPGGSPSSIKACSRFLATKYDNSFSKGMSPQDAAAGKTNMCAEANFKYDAKAFRPPSSHTEARILETVMAAKPPAGTTVLMSINWKQGVDDDGNDIIDNSPCGHCEKVICAAQACGIVVKLCQGDPPSPQDPPKCK